ncbi:exopolysaccharide biosynthesis protein [Erythrobacter rubeus]|uniref:Exopolysaccharide biosynthesis protein n=1 Tax=Erythrobacter rubeus TaxID=2760803 RepID=A0ABR8KQC7_9SPHN|nr:exopolysaccharide biosynthesis protein [Erythrobacter rubeus]MBD2840649.1 exopolysaccharide biosynthesis protein [Erythrobacter rubeus]
MPEDTKDPHSIGDVVEGLSELAEAERQVSIGDVLDKFGNRSFAPVMMIFALLELTPVGVIPGVPSFLALCVILIAVQLLIGREHIWVPDWIEDRAVTSSKLEKATDKLEGPADTLDTVAKGRLEFLAQGPALRVAAAIIIALALAVPPLELLPWASMGPMIAISIICLAIMVRDGLAMLLAWVLAAAAMVGLGFYYFGSDAAGGGYLPVLMGA